MDSYDSFFWSVVFFLSGALLSSLGAKTEILVIFLILCLGSLAFSIALKNKSYLHAIPLFAFLLIGAIFYTSSQITFEKSSNFPFDKEIRLTGQVITNPEITNLQQFKLRLEKSYSGTILVNALPAPKIEYGDIVEIKGKIQIVEGGYYLKEKVHGRISYPKNIKIIEKGKTSLKKYLFSIREKILKSFQKVLSYEEAGLLGGLTLGSTEYFSKELKESMRKSGTLHIVALSGYNISIILVGLSGYLTLFFRKKTALIIALFITLIFILMTGAEPSIVRAGIMGAIAAIAPLIGRIYEPRNIIAFSGLVMTFQNPNVLAFDIGFQLSFLALISIIYIKPVIQKIIRNPEPGLILENLLLTVSAQITVAPLLLFYFGNISLIAVLSNLLILPIIPYTMVLGFITASLGLISYKLSLLSALPALILLRVEIAIIKLFGS